MGEPRRTPVGFTLIAGGMLAILSVTNNGYDTQKARDLSRRLQEIKPEANADKNDWARLTLDRIGLRDTSVGFDIDLRYSANSRGTGIEVYNSGKYLGTVELDRAQDYLDSLRKQ